MGTSVEPTLIRFNDGTTQSTASIASPIKSIQRVSATMTSATTLNVTINSVVLENTILNFTGDANNYVFRRVLVKLTTSTNVLITKVSGYAGHIVGFEVIEFY